MGNLAETHSLGLISDLQTLCVGLFVLSFLTSGLLGCLVLSSLLLHPSLWPLALAYLTWIYWDRSTCHRSV